MTVSLDGLKEDHDWLRDTPGSFERAIALLKLLSGSRLIYDVLTCVNRYSFSQLPQIKELLISLGVPAWRIFSIFPEGRAAQHPGELSSGKHLQGRFHGCVGESFPALQG
jgi:MoaA/NifB/PqqE/SkfB family radical SAM enzyme